MGAPSKRAKRVRAASEFDIERLSRTIGTPRGSGIPLTSWTLAEIFAARDAQLRGDFFRPAKMAEAMRTDDALAVPFRNRLAPLQCLKVKIKPAKGNPKAQSIANEADGQFGQGGVALHPDTLSSIHECLTNHNVAFACITAIPRADGSRVDYEVRAWPIENVYWNAYERTYKTRIDPATAEDGEGYEIPITHGDGRWVVFQRNELDPFKHAAILAAANVWARHAYAVRDWAKGSVAHGNAKILATMPEGVPLQDASGALSPEAEAMAALLRAFSSSDSPVGIKPAGSTVDFLTNTSSQWQIFAELILNAEKAGARIYLGTDAVMGSQGGAPGVNIEALFGVARTYVQSDIACISRGLQTGVIAPWTAINFGDSSLAPERVYIFPDEDEDAAREAESKRVAAFFDEFERAKKNGFEITQAYVDELAERHGVEAPRLVVKQPAEAAPTTPAPQ